MIFDFGIVYKKQLIGSGGIRTHNPVETGA